MNPAAMKFTYKHFTGWNSLYRQIDDLDQWRHRSALRDGKELFFLAADGKLMSVVVKSALAAEFKTDAPQPLFEIPPILSRIANGSFRYAVSSDGQRFLVLLGPNEPPQPLTVITNWQSAVKK